MSNPGQANNPGGINSFSGPLGQKDPAYGMVEREQVLTRSAPGVSNPDQAAQRSQRRATRKGGDRPAAAPPGPLAAPHAPTATAQVDQTAFWQGVLNDPGASDLTREYASRALNGQV